MPRSRLKRAADARPLAFGRQRRVEARPIELEALLAQYLFGQLDRETVGLVQVEGAFAADRRLAADRASATIRSIWAEPACSVSTEQLLFTR